MAKLVMNLAISLDGYICEEDGSFDWIEGHHDDAQNTNDYFDQDTFVQTCDSIVMGYTSYLDCLPYLDEYKDKQIYVATSKKLDVLGNVVFVNEEIVDFILHKKEEGETIWVYGGAQLCDAFLKRDVIDEYIIGIIPIILGKGRRLFTSQLQRIPLHFDKSSVRDGIVILEYTRRR